MTKSNHDKHQKPLRAVISGGGTGGHIFPALSIANALRRQHPDVEIIFVGAQGRMEMERVPAAGYEIVGLPVAGFDRRRLWRNVGVVIKLMRSMLKARKLIKTFKPDIAVGVGGYASGPTLKAAQRAGVPTVIQEQNSYAGVTNKLLAKKARKICVAYSGMERFFPEESIVMTGNPVRHDIATAEITKREAKTKLGFDAERPLVLVVGGSLGARTINESIAAGLDEIVKTGAQLMWQTGKYYIDAYSHYSQPDKGVKVSAFISDMALNYRAADLVVSRAGAGTISELQILGLPVILVPSPNVAEDHQRKNALALVEKDAAVMVTDADAPSQLAKEIVSLIADESRRERLSANIAQMAMRDSDDVIAKIIFEIVESKNQQ